MLARAKQTDKLSKNLRGNAAIGQYTWPLRRRRQFDELNEQPRAQTDIEGQDTDNTEISLAFS